MYESLYSNGSPNSSEQSFLSRSLENIIHEKEAKIFVGGLKMSTTDDRLFMYFSQFGKINEAVVMRDAKTKMSRGFAFVTFFDSFCVEKVLAMSEHYLDGKKIDPQPAIPDISPARSVHNTFKKVFMGGISPWTTAEHLKDYFTMNFGEVEDLVLKYDYSQKVHRGFGFITFVDHTIADQVCTVRKHWIHGKIVECKQAQKKGFVTQSSPPISEKYNGIMLDKIFEYYAKIKAEPVDMSQDSNDSSYAPTILNVQPGVDKPKDHPMDTEPSFRRRIAMKYGASTYY